MMTENSIEKHSFKITIGVAISVLIFIITMSYNIAVWTTQTNADLNEINDRIDHLSEKYVTMREDISSLESKANERDIQLTEIKTKLVNIETLLVEIKQKIN